MEDLPAPQSSYEIILLQAEKCYLTGQENYNAGKLFRDGDGNKYKRAKAIESFKSAAEKFIEAGEYYDIFDKHSDAGRAYFNSGEAYFEAGNANYFMFGLAEGEGEGNDDKVKYYIVWDKAAEQYIKAGKEYAKAGKHSDAGDSHFKAGKSFIGLRGLYKVIGRGDEATYNYNKSIMAFTKSAEEYNKGGEEYIKTGQYCDAGRAYFNSGNAYYNMESYNKAEEQYIKAGEEYAIAGKHSDAGDSYFKAGHIYIVDNNIDYSKVKLFIEFHNKGIVYLNKAAEEYTLADQHYNAKKTYDLLGHVIVL